MANKHSTWLQAVAFSSGIRLKPQIWFLLGGLALMAVHHWYVRGFVIDDSYITFRYARNLAEGYGPVYNIGERVEGYSNFLWMILLACGFMLRIDPVVFSKVLGVLLSLVTMILTYRLSALITLDQPPHLSTIVAPLLLSISAPFILWATSGLETPLYTALLTAGLYFGLRETRSQTGFPWSSVCFAALALTRPEGALVGGLMFGYQWLMGRRAGQLLRRRDVLWLGVFLVIAFAWHAWRITYYGWLLPNTYYAKMKGASGLIDGLRYTWKFARSLFGGNAGVGVGVVFILIGWGQGLRAKRLRAEHALLAGVVMLHTMIVIYAGGDWMPFARFFVPILSVVWLMIQIAVQGLWGMPGLARWQTMGRVAATLLPLLLVAQSVRNSLSAWPVAARIEHTTAIWAELGLRLRQRFPGNVKLAEVSAGALPYYSRFYLIDMVGLVDETVAHLPVTPRLDGKFATIDHLAAREPDLIMLATHESPSRGCCKTFIPQMVELYHSEFFQSNYQFVDAFSFTELDGSEAWLMLFQRISATH